MKYGSLALDEILNFYVHLSFEESLDEDDIIIGLKRGLLFSSRSIIEEWYILLQMKQVSKYGDFVSLEDAEKILFFNREF